MRPSRPAGFFNILSAAIIGMSLAATPALAKAPQEGSKDWNEFKMYRDFIKVMGHCCSDADGRIPHTQKEKVNAKGETVYRVFMLERSFVTDDPTDQDSNDYRKLFKEKGEYYQGQFGLWVEVPPEKIIPEKQAIDKCKPIIAKNELDRAVDPSVPEHTCNPPIIPILWLNKNGSPYCFWPERKMGAVQPAIRFGSLALRMA